MNRFYKSGIILGLSFMVIFIGFIYLNADYDGFRGQQLQWDANEQELLGSHAMDQVLAEDLAMTTSMFISQLSFQLSRWADQDVSDQTLYDKFIEELQEHPHFNSFALLEDNEITMAVGEIHEDRIHELDLQNKTRVFSRPYQLGGKQFMLMKEQLDDGRNVVGEIDLTFVASYVKDIASVADESGHFFISGGDHTEAEWTTTKELPDSIAAQTVPELDWQIVVHSEEDEDVQEFYERQAVVKFINEQQGLDWINRTEDISIFEDSSPYYVIESQTLSAEELLRELEANENTELAEPNFIITKQTRAQVTVPNDEFFGPYQWNLSQISAESGWNFSGGAEDVIIAIIDTGVDPNHQDLQGKVLEGFNAFDGSNRSDDEHGHGTHVAGIAAALTNNVTGIAGVAWENLILPIKVLDANGEGTSFEVARGVRWAVDHGADVINMSLGDYHSSLILHDAIKYADRNNVVLIAASGNDNTRRPMYPARYPEVLTVGAVSEGRHRAFFSNYGKHIDVAAPGEHIPSLFPNNNYVIMSGTSMAAPHVAGLAGLLLAVDPTLSNQDVYDIIKGSSIDLGRRGRDPFYGFGEINVAEALRMVR
ncbi:S8 family peptidase [Bacillus alkalicellulosilyticus]|uniref:S8 family peptidase n=1 Tax=Alkalihalobacterium alkalicellulosilyticum TaxID=1912214 RepID=UPI0009980582|nr:S8 family peptidase [Bacillus alkalicellulosilyticus]